MTIRTTEDSEADSDSDSYSGSGPEWADSVQDLVPDQQTNFVYDNASREVDVAIADETNFSSTIAAGRRVDVDNVRPRPPPVLPSSLAVEL